MSDVLNSLSRHWLFGEKTSNDSNVSKANDTDAKNPRCRGWFPRKCAVELVNPDSDDEHEHFTAKKIN